ncbi:uncharacterized protein LOC103317511 [Nasonia vitripennis]|uniref:Uncharacterized protein n=1 Tax=Nasonia vitripennis TaxID=7425 RepID=A0A7M7LV20_NASVI|nr:uncharacterized protein LOC103317511 [Nasonia vitripennis]
MSDSEEEVKEEEVYELTIVRFVHRGRRRAVEQIDIINSEWLSFDGKKGKCTTQFLDKVHTQEDINLLHSLVKELAPAPESWPWFSVEIIGRAKTYHKALQKLKLLQSETNVLTEDTEDDQHDVQKKMENEIRQRQLQKQLNDLKSSYAVKSKETTTKPSTKDKKAGKEVSNKKAATIKIKEKIDEEQPDDTEHNKSDAGKEALISVHCDQEDTIKTYEDQ